LCVFAGEYNRFILVVFRQ